MGEQPRRGWKLHFAKAQSRDKKAEHRPSPPLKGRESGLAGEVGIGLRRVAVAVEGRGESKRGAALVVAPRLAVLWF